MNKKFTDFIKNLTKFQKTYKHVTPTMAMHRSGGFTFEDVQETEALFNAMKNIGVIEPLGDSFKVSPTINDIHANLYACSNLL